MQTKVAYSMSQYLRDLARFIAPYKDKFLIGTFLRFTKDLAALYPAWALSQVVIILTAEDYSSDLLPKLFIVWMILAIYMGIAHSTAKYFGYRVAEMAAIDVKLSALKHVYNLDLSWQESENSGNKMKRIDHGARAINESIRIFFNVLIEGAINVIGIIIIFWTIDLKIALGIAFFMATYAFVSIKLTQKASNQAYIVNKKEEVVEGITFESLNNIKSIKALGMKDSIIRLLQSSLKELNDEIKKRIMLFQTRGMALNSYYLIFQTLMVIYITYSIIQGNYAVSVLVLFWGYIKKVEEAIAELSEFSHELMIFKIQFSRVMDILSIKPTIEIDQNQLDYPTNWQDIKLQNINFGYGDDKVLNDLDLVVKRGDKIGIVGLSGAGKSTLFKLLMDLYENYDGEIMIGDKPLKEIDRLSYIDNVAVVLQDTELFNASLKDNILLAGRRGQEYDERKLLEAISISHLDEVVNRLPNGMETVIGEKGVKLSGGEKQRLGIARALYRDPDILLLDEATSHLDVNSERKIQDSLSIFFKKVTAIVIAHRLSTIKEMDRIIVLHDGKIIEQGTFAELVSQNGAFKDMWEKQKL